VCTIPLFRQTRCPTRRVGALTRHTLVPLGATKAGKRQNAVPRSCPVTHSPDRAGNSRKWSTRKREKSHKPIQNCHNLLFVGTIVKHLPAVGQVVGRKNGLQKERKPTRKLVAEFVRIRAAGWRNVGSLTTSATNPFFRPRWSGNRVNRSKMWRAGKIRRPFHDRLFRRLRATILRFVAFLRAICPFACTPWRGTKACGVPLACQCNSRNGPQ